MGPSAFRLTGLAGKIRALGFEVHDRGNVPVSIPEGLILSALGQRIL